MREHISDGRISRYLDRCKFYRFKICDQLSSTLVSLALLTNSTIDTPSNDKRSGDVECHEECPQRLQFISEHPFRPEMEGNSDKEE